MSRVLLICGQTPYTNNGKTFIKGGIESRILNYKNKILTPEHEVYFLFHRDGMTSQLVNSRNQIKLNPTNNDLKSISPDIICCINDDINFFDLNIVKDRKESTRLVLMTQKCREGTPDKYDFVITNYSEINKSEKVYEVGGFYDENIFFKKRIKEKYVLSVGRVHHTKNQLELVKNYKREIYLKHKVPLLLVGGTFTDSYFKEVASYVDGVMIKATFNIKEPYSLNNWVNGKRLAALYNSAKIYACPSKQETLGLSVLEACACGSTCVVDGEYPGLPQEEFKEYVVGDVYKYNGHIIENIDRALTEDINKDASEWIKRYSIKEKRKEILDYFRKII